MVIRIFVLSMLLLAVLSYFIPVDAKKKKANQEDVALLTFHDSTMYTLNTENMNRVIYADKAIRYRKKDVMYNGALTLKSKDKSNKEITEVLFADLIIKRGDLFKFINNVKYKRDNYVTLNTDELLYNDKDKIAVNTVPFDGTYYEHYIKGENIYLDLNKHYMKAKKTHFEIITTKKQ